jgi:multidrug resistance efflux pump
MAKVIKTTTLLADESGKVWVEAQLSEAQVKRIIKGYERAGVSLTAYGSPNQVMAQVEAINAVLDSNQIARSMRESGRLVVMGVGY